MESGKPDRTAERQPVDAPLTVLDLVQSWGPKSGGVKRYIQDKMSHFAAVDDIDHHLVIPADADRVFRQLRTTTHGVRAPRIPCTQGYRIMTDRGAMLKVVERVRPDVIEVGNPYLPAWVAVESARRWHIPAVGFYHSDYPRALADKIPGAAGAMADRWMTPLIEGYLKRLYERMAAVVVSTGKFEKMLNRIGVERTVRIPLGTDTDKFRPRASRQKVFAELSLSGDTMLLLFAGRFAGMKNLDDLLGMMERLPSEQGPYHLLLIGDGELRDMVRTAHRQRGDVTWKSYVDDPVSLSEYYSAADLFINPGTHETFGLVSVEAQACGTRVLGVRGGGMDETLEGESPLIMADHPDPQTLAEAVGAVRRLNESEADRRRRRQRIVDMFSLQTTFDRLTRLYRGLARDARRQ